MGNFSKAIRRNLVPIIFAVIVFFAFQASKIGLPYFLMELISRISRNSILILALIIPCAAGLGMNFSITLGAMAAQAGIILITHWHVQGVKGILLAIVIAIPIAMLLGWLMGQLFNHTKGQEMITGMIAGYFGSGVYQLIFIVLLGSVIPFVDPVLILNGGVGLVSTITIESPRALDKLIEVRADLFFAILCASAALYFATKMVLAIVTVKKGDNEKTKKSVLLQDGSALVLFTGCVAFIELNTTLKKALGSLKVPIATIILVALVAIMIRFILKTKLGQDLRAVGNDMKVASASGINVDKTRIIAIMISTSIAAIGQTVFLQNITSFTTYSAHESVATYAVASILIGGATVKRATVKNALLGVVLFNALFIVAPQASVKLLGNSLFGEYFRIFVSYGVIAVSLVLNAVQNRKLQIAQMKEKMK